MAVSQGIQQAMGSSTNFHQHGPNCNHGHGNMERGEEKESTEPKGHPIFDAVKSG